MFNALRLRFGICLCFTICCHVVFAQNDLNSGSGEINNSFGEVSFSFGILVGDQIENAEYSILFGIQQPEMKENNSLNQLVRFNYLVYPNPASNYLTIKRMGLNNSEYCISIYNNVGQLVMEKPSILGEINTIDVCNLSTGTYFLKIFSNNNRTDIIKFNKL
jgi:hypothetical protein